MIRKFFYLMLPLTLLFAPLVRERSEGNSPRPSRTSLSCPHFTLKLCLIPALRPSGVCEHRPNLLPLPVGNASSVGGAPFPAVLLDQTLFVSQCRGKQHALAEEVTSENFARQQPSIAIRTRAPTYVCTLQKHTVLYCMTAANITAAAPKRVTF